jgi:hypothetical protein
MYLDRLNAKLGDLETQIERVKARSVAELAVLNKQRAILLSVRDHLTPENEAALEALESIGVLSDAL